MDVNKLNTTALAYIGDAVYEVWVRERILNTCTSNIDAIHKKAIKYVRAESQALAIRRMFDSLSESEQVLVKRARNHKISSKPKNANPVTYKMATAFEALIGYLYASGEKERLSEVILLALEIIDEEGNDVKRKQGRKEAGQK